MTLTTTSKIEILQNGIVVNQLITKSGFKPAYIYEQALELKHLCEIPGKPLLLDLSQITFTFSELNQLITHVGFKKIKTVAILIDSDLKKILFQLWYSFNKLAFPFHFFANKNDAFNWLQSTFK